MLTKPEVTAAGKENHYCLGTLIKGKNGKVVKYCISNLNFLLETDATPRM